MGAEPEPAEEREPTELELILARNSERLLALNARKVNVNIDSLLLRYVVQTLVPTQEEAAVFEAGFQRFLSTMLDSIESRVNETQLLRAAPSLIVPS